MKIIKGLRKNRLLDNCNNHTGCDTDNNFPCGGQVNH